MKVPSRAELGHFSFRAETELNFFSALIKNYNQISQFSYTQCPRAKWFFNVALIERNMQVKFDLKLSVYSLGLDI